MKRQSFIHLQCLSVITLLFLTLTMFACAQNHPSGSSKPLPTPPESVAKPAEAVKSANGNSAGKAVPQIGIVLTDKDVPLSAASIEEFAPTGWFLMGKASGDLNGDKIPDAVAAFSKARLFDGKTEATHSSKQSDVDVNTARVLIIAFGDGHGGLTLSTYSQNVILDRTAGGELDDPFISVKIAEGFIELRYNQLSSVDRTLVIAIRFINKAKWYVVDQNVVGISRGKGGRSGAATNRHILLKDFSFEEILKPR